MGNPLDGKGIREREKVTITAAGIAGQFLERTGLLFGIKGQQEPITDRLLRSAINLLLSS